MVSYNPLFFNILLKKNPHNKNTKIKEVLYMAIVEINKSDFQDILKNNKKILLDFYAPWCAPCKTLAPVMEKVAEENPDVLIGKINVDEEPELVTEFCVSGIPFLVVIKNGEIVSRASGVKPKGKINEMLVN